jgi:FdhD protein
MSAQLRGEGRIAGTTRRGAASRPASAGHAQALAEEVPAALVYNGLPHAVMLVSPCDLEDFAIGFSLSGGVVEHPDEIESVAVRRDLAGIELAIRIPDQRAARLAPDTRSLAGNSACGLCGVRRLEDAVRAPRAVTAQVVSSGAAVHRALAALRKAQAMHRATGATHAAAWADAEGELGWVREDVGRHNALDKLVGALARAGAEPGAGMLLMTSRASVELVQKAATAGAGILVAISAPTALAVSLADGAGLTLLGFARDGRHSVYTHPWRLREPAPEGGNGH